MSKQITQEYIDGLQAGMDKTRSEYHVTLGELIGRLENVDQDALVIAKLPTSSDPRGELIDWGVGKCDSYRGYYSDLAFEPVVVHAACTVADLLKECRHALGMEFRGYKGGEFLMTADTSLWISGYGVCDSHAIIDTQMLSGEFIIRVKKMRS